jgi:hypothetical protein
VFVGRKASVVSESHVSVLSRVRSRVQDPSSFVPIPATPTCPPSSPTSVHLHRTAVQSSKVTRSHGAPTSHIAADRLSNVRKQTPPLSVAKHAPVPSQVKGFQERQLVWGGQGAIRECLNEGRPSGVRRRMVNFELAEETRERGDGGHCLSCAVCEED